LFGAGFWVLYEAVSRMGEPRSVPGLPVLAEQYQIANTTLQLERESERELAF
jgi:hypothetical protein